MTRPAPRKSSLTGSSPITPPPATRSEVAAPIEAPRPSAEDTTPRPASVPPRGKYPPKVSFYQNSQDTGRMRGALLHTQVSEGTRSLSQFIHEAVMEKVTALEAKYNGGEPFPAIGARELPQGRPMGE